MSELDAYDYDLPDELIAQHPLQRREDARLLVVDRASGEIEHAHVRDLDEWLRPSDALVLNDTKVLPARLVGFRTKTGGRWQGLFLSADAQGLWQVMSKTRGRLDEGETVTLQDAVGVDRWQLTMVKRLDGGLWAARPAVSGDLESRLMEVGRVPLPPYIRGGEMLPADVDQYQTVYAEKPGAVAAPTAGLHFTPALLGRVAQQGTAIHRITLHVGIGTFRPIATERLADHTMHREWGTIDEATVKALRDRRSAGGRIVAVGTTAVRVLETAALDGQLRSWSGETDLFIRPPFTFHGTDALMTNFHLPRSSLLVLVRTFGGDELIRGAYEAAIRERYRFYSYGDAMLITG